MWMDKRSLWAAGRFAAVLIVTGVLTACWAETAGARQKAAKAASPTRLGDIAIERYESMKITTPSGAYVDDLKGSPVVITSPTYRFNARSIHFVVRAAEKGYKATNVTAIEDVRIEIQDPDPDHLTTLTCGKAVYTATVAPKDKGRLELTEHVHMVRKDPKLAEPFVSDSETASVTFDESGNPEIDLHNGKASVTPLEPPAKPASKPPKK